MEPSAGPALHPLLAARSSPAQFDAAVEVGAAEVDTILEAARWAPSAGNSQPWAFVVGVRGDDTHARLLPHLARSSAGWASSAALLIVNLCHRYVEGTDWEYSEFSLYDLGQAVAHMTVQAQSVGLSTRQFRAFDRDALTQEFDVPAHWQIATMSAVGRPATSATARSAGPTPPVQRSRRPVEHLVWPHAVSDLPRQ